MALTAQKIADAEADLDDLASVVNGGIGEVVATRTGGNLKTLATVLDELEGAADGTAFADITGAPNDNVALDAVLDAKAEKTDAVLLGAPSAPTPAPGTNTDQLATAAFVQAAVAALINSAPGALNTLDELANALGDDANFAATMTAALAAKLDDSQATAFGLSLLGAASAAATKTLLALAKADVGLGNADNTSDANKPVSTATQTALNGKAALRSTIDAKNASYAAADADHDKYIVYSGAGTPTLTLGNMTAGTSFTGRFSTAWAVACASGLSKNGASPTGVTTGAIAAGKLVTFLCEGGGVWVASGDVT